MMPNASNTDRVRDATGGIDTTADRCVLAVQGPNARVRLAQIVPEAAEVERFHVAPFEWGGAPCVVAGTGYTGEDGVECAVPAEVAPALWSALLGDRHPSRRARCPRHAPARGRVAAARPRARPGDHTSPSGPRMGRRMGEGRLPRPCGPRRRTPTRSARDCSSAWPAKAGSHLEPDRKWRGTTGRPGRSPAATTLRCSDTGSRSPSSDTDPDPETGMTVEIDQRGRVLPATLVPTPFVRAGQFASAAVE